MKSKEGNSKYSSCVDQNTLIAYLNGGLSGVEMNAVERHLSACIMCTDELEGLSELNNPDAISDIEKELNRKIDSVLTGKKSQPFTSTRLFRVAATLALLLAISSLVYYTATLKPTTEVLSERLIVREEQLVVEEEYIDEPIVTQSEETPAKAKHEVQEPESPSTKSMDSELHTEFVAKKSAPRASQGAIHLSPKKSKSVEVLSIVEDDIEIFDIDTNIGAVASENISLSELAPVSDIAYFEEVENEEEEIFVIVDEMPRFKGGGIEKFQEYLSENLKYPETAKESSIQGVVIVQFEVDTDGLIDNVRVVRGLHKELDNEAVRVIKESPKWMPGKQRGREVKVSFTLPIEFLL